MKTAVLPSIITLSGGLRLVHLHMRSAGAGIFGIDVKAGSACEENDRHGLAHFVEHTIFKGTSKRSSWHIINRMEAVGGELNAFTTKEETVVYSIFPSGNAPRAIELIADLAFESRFPERELIKEREVVIDEINSYRDTPSEAIYDDFEEYAFAGTALAHNILGDEASVRRLGSEDCRDFIERYYTGPNMVAFYCGPQSADHIAGLIERHFAGTPGRCAVQQQRCATALETFDKRIQLGTHQCHALMGAATGGIHGSDRYAVALLANITGGPGMNSLLNIELREKRGLVYSVETSTAQFNGVGLLNVYFGCDKDDLERCLRLCRDVFSGIADGSSMNERSLAKAKKQYLGQLAIASENRENRIMALSRATLFCGSPATPKETAEAIEALTTADIAAVAEKMLQSSTLIYY